MRPAELQGQLFTRYPPQGRKLAASHIALLRELPVGFVPFLLKEIRGYDWKFPAECSELDRQLVYLESLSPELRRREMSVFAHLRLAPALENFDWVDSPAQFLEQLTAHLWATHQIDAFRAASEDYIHNFNAASAPEPPAAARLVIVTIGQGVTENRYALFRNLRRQGVYYSGVKPDNGLAAILQAARSRAAARPQPFAHWYIDGDQAAAACPELAVVSYNRLTPARTALQNKMRQAYESPSFGAEALRTMLARLTPEEIGMGGTGKEGVMSRFQLSLLSEGSGTQVFSTTFVQWAAREALRRAQPLTLVVRFAPRQREQPMNELLAEAQHAPVLDPQGSLIDADMGAYYTWLNQQRLPGAEQSSFLAWFEGHGEGIAIAPELPRGVEDRAALDMDQLLRRLNT